MSLALLILSLPSFFFPMVLVPIFFSLTWVPLFLYVFYLHDVYVHVCILDSLIQKFWTWVLISFVEAFLAKRL